MSALLAMNYRHSYHAGNFADVIKHLTLVLVADYLKQKPKPFSIIDTHAGCGFYDLGSEQAQKTGEWKDGIARLIGPDARAIEDEALGEHLAPYLDLVRGCNELGSIRRYPGSPWFAHALLRPGDKLIANELHVEDYGHLQNRFAKIRAVETRNQDGWALLKAVLPPLTRRGLILIDPPFEVAGELDRLAAELARAVKRFANGVYILWYPIKARAPVDHMYQAMSALGVPKLLRAELMIRDHDQPDTLNGCGLLILNPPYTLHDKLSLILPELALRFAAPGHNGASQLNWLVP